ncbi:MAG: glycosyltransferase family 2 protein [Bacteroidales bacterium]|nr:glycosyltransferase family 2 protein [Bacteroidales bacterium]
MINYSIIIPHKNTPDLLQRCLDSIPERTDVQIIIIDDNSSPEKVNFDCFPGKDRKDTEIIFSKGKSGKGPGYARNAGMSVARGKWVIFSDADDYFTQSFNELLDKHIDDKNEIVFFKCLRETIEGTISDYPLINNAIDKAIESKTPDSIALGVPCPWGKFIKRNFIVKHGIRYQEITGGDDILFSIRLALNLKNWAACEPRLYCVADRPGSLTRNNNWQSFYSYSLACCSAYTLLKTVSKESLAVAWLISWWGFLWAENKLAASWLIPRIVATLRIKDAAKAIRKGIKRGRWDWRGA